MSKLNVLEGYAMELENELVMEETYPNIVIIF